MTPQSTTVPDLPEVPELTLEELEELDQHWRESLETFRRVEAHHASEIARLEAEIEELTASLADVPDGTDSGARGTFQLKQRIIRNEYKRDVALDENRKLQPQIDEAQTAITANEKAIETRRKDLS